MGLGEGVVVSGRGYEKKRGIKGKIKYKVPIRTIPLFWSSVRPNSYNILKSLIIFIYVLRFVIG